MIWLMPSALSVSDSALCTSAPSGISSNASSRAWSPLSAICGRKPRAAIASAASVRRSASAGSSNSALTGPGSGIVMLIGRCSSTYDCCSTNRCSTTDVFANANDCRRYTGRMATEPTIAAQQSSSVLIAVLARGMRRRIELALEPIGVRPRHLLVLSHLRSGGAAAQQTLLDVAGVDPSNLVGLLNELEDAGLIVRSRDRADRRRGVIELSRKG